ncbi:MAG TPA: HAMP domain-containing sensor histidine kinase [Verrucomicrobiae bacterium]|jgi:signal transduction histidine kinase|nr:HAMP domain-containing sensor histidine kinase [Verrucomicrobiae bacterium]
MKEKSPSFFRPLEYLPYICGCAAILFAWYVLFGRFRHWPDEDIGLPGFSPMKANTALAMMFGGLSLALSAQKNRRLFWIAKISAAICCIVGMLTLAEYILGVDFKVDQALIFDPYPAPGGLFPARMMPFTAFNFFIFGLALIVVDLPAGYWPAQCLNIAVLWIAVVGFMRYFYKIEAIYRIGVLSGMAAESAINMILLCLGFLFVRPKEGVAAVLTASTVGGLTARKLLPSVILMPVVLGWLPLIGVKGQYYTAEFGVMLLVVSIMVIFSIIIFLNAHYLDKLDRERAVAEKELADMNRELNDFAYVVAHDLKAPVTAIQTLTSWIDADYGRQFNPKSQEQVQLILSNAKHMRNMIDGILDYSKAGRSKEQKQLVDLNELVVDVTRLLCPPASIQINVENKLPVLPCEKVRVSQIFQNLLGNAVKFMDKAEGLICVSSSEHNGDYQFEIRDNGPGIPQEVQERAFHIFHTYSSHPDSTGLGLSITKKMVESMGGKIWLRSQPGQGAAFFFTLPRN